MDFYSKDIKSVFNQTKSNLNGLKNDEAHSRLILNGKNVLPQSKQQSKILRFLKQFCDVMIVILFVASFISITVAIAEKSYGEMIDGFIILAIVIINAILGFVQEVKAEKSVKELLTMTEPEVKIKRSGEYIKIHSSELVFGDIVFLEAVLD